MARSAPAALPTVDQIRARQAQAAAELDTAADALAEAIDQEIADGKTNTPLTIDARRKLAQAAQAVDDIDLALTRAIDRDAADRIVAKNEADEARYTEAVAMVPELLRLGREMGHTRGANSAVNQAFVTHGMALLRTLPHPPSEARGDLLTLPVAARQERWMSTSSRHPKSFAEKLERSIAWWCGIDVATVRALTQETV